MAQKIAAYSNVVPERRVHEQMCCGEIMRFANLARPVHRNTSVGKRAREATNMWKSAISKLIEENGAGLIRGWCVIQLKRDNKTLIVRAGIGRRETRDALSSVAGVSGYEDFPSANHLLSRVCRPTADPLSLHDQCHIISCFPCWKVSVLENSRKYDSNYTVSSPREVFLSERFVAEQLFPRFEGESSHSGSRHIRRRVTAPATDWAVTSQGIPQDHASTGVPSPTGVAGTDGFPMVEHDEYVGTDTDTESLLRVGGLMRELVETGFCLVLDDSPRRLRVVWAAIRTSSTGV